MLIWIVRRACLCLFAYLLICFSFNHNVPIPSTITSMPLFSYVSLLISTIFYILTKKVYFGDIKYTSFNQLKSSVTNSWFFLNSHYLVSYFLVGHWLLGLTFSFILSNFCFPLIIALHSSWLISMSINAWDTKVSMLSSLHHENIIMFFLFLSCHA